MKRLCSVFCLLFFLVFQGCAAFSLVSSSPKTYQETYFATTEDDWSLALHRYYRKGAVKYKNPVILCHGMAYNAAFWDIDKKRSFAKFLADQGFDVWAVSLRGSGKSTKTGWLAFRDILSFRFDDLSNVSLDAEKLNWDIDDHIYQDIPSIIAKVREVTGASQVDWVGHSMGAMIILAYLETTQKPEEIGSVVAVAPGCAYLKPRNAGLDFIEQKRIIFDAGLLINQKNLYKFLVPFHGSVRDPLAGLYYSKDNMAPGTISNLYNDVVENISPGVLDQLIQMLHREYFYSSDGKINYSEALGEVKNPILFVAGRDDNVASPESVRFGYRKVSSRDKTYLEFSRSNGAKKDYGHNDLIIGKNAPVEVYPKIFYWLESRSKPK